MFGSVNGERRFSESYIAKVWDHERDLVLAYKRKDLLVVFKFNPSNSYSDYGMMVKKGVYQILLDTDNKAYGGFGFNDDTEAHVTQSSHLRNKEWLKLYLPSRSALVLKRVE